MQLVQTLVKTGSEALARTSSTTFVELDVDLEVRVSRVGAALELAGDTCDAFCSELREHVSGAQSIFSFADSILRRPKVGIEPVSAGSSFISGDLRGGCSVTDRTARAYLCGEAAAKFRYSEKLCVQLKFLKFYF